MKNRAVRATFAITVSLVTLLLLTGAATAQSAKAQGLITGRNGDTMTVQTPDSTNVVVLLTDSTQVAQIQGVFKARRKQMSMAALIPGLQVQVQGSYNAQNQLVASSIKFKGKDLEDAQTSFRAGLQPTKEQAEQTQQELEAQKAALARQQQAMQEQQQQMAQAQAKIDANKAAIEAANKRFGQLDDYNILDEVTVYFANGKVTVDPKYKPQLLYPELRRPRKTKRLSHPGKGLCVVGR